MWAESGLPDTCENTHAKQWACSLVTGNQADIREQRTAANSRSWGTHSTMKSVDSALADGNSVTALEEYRSLQASFISTQAHRSTNMFGYPWSTRDAPAFERERFSKTKRPVPEPLIKPEGTSKNHDENIFLVDRYPWLWP